MIDGLRPGIAPITPGLDTPLTGAANATPTGAAAATGGSFVDSIGAAVSALNTQLTGADSAMTSFAAGESSADLHQVLLQMQEASIALSTATAVRDRLLDAYGEVMRLNV
mgnify:CR=1 FL=1